jgi:hypothetical protein
MHAISVQKYFISFADVDVGQTRHQCVFLRCNREGYAMQAAEFAYKAFDLEPKPYLPHCSLLYSDIGEAERSVVSTSILQCTTIQFFCLVLHSVAMPACTVQHPHVYRDKAEWQHGTPCITTLHTLHHHRRVLPWCMLGCSRMGIASGGLHAAIQTCHLCRCLLLIIPFTRLPGAGMSGVCDACHCRLCMPLQTMHATADDAAQPLDVPCRCAAAEEVQERLYGPLQGYGSLLVETGFWVTALHVYETPWPADEASWPHVARFSLSEAAS